MKKNTILIIGLITVMTISYQLYAQNLNEGFEGDTVPPDLWTVMYANPEPPDGNLVRHSSTYAHQGEQSFRFSSFSLGEPYDQYLVTPRLVSTEDDRTISFYYRQHTAGQEVFRVGWSTTGTDLQDFQWSEDITNASQEWQQFVKDDLPIGNVYFCIHYFSDYQWYLYIDTVQGPQIWTPNEPPAPARIVSPEDRETNVSITANLNWEPSDPYPQTFDVYFGTELPDEPVSANQEETFYNPGVLDYDTTYFWKIVPRNEFGPAADSPMWSFATTGDGSINEFPWNESFAGEEFPPQSWEQHLVVGESEWIRASGGHSDNPDGAQDGEFNARYYGGANRGDTAYLLTPPFDFTELDIPELIFWHAQAVWAGDQDHLSVYYSDSPAGEWQRIAHYTENIPEWTERTIFLPDSLETAYLKFEAYADYGYGVVLDNITVREAEGIPPPSNLHAANITSHSADLAWRENGRAEAWDIEFGPFGFNPTGEPTHPGVTDNPYTITELNHSSSYQFYVRSNLGEDEYSEWSGPADFNTTQIPAELPFTENFDDDIHWQLINDGQENQWVVGQATSFTGDFSAYISNDGGENNFYDVNQTSYVHIYRDIYFPEDAERNFELSFSWKGQGEGQDPWYYDFMTVHLTPADVIPVAGETIDEYMIGEVFNMQGEWNQEMFELADSLYAGQTHRLVFTWHNDSSLGTQPPAAIDNISLSQIAEHPAPRQLNVTNITSNSASLGWTEIGDATAWDIELGERDFDPTGVPTRAGVTDNPYLYDNLEPGTDYDFYVRSNYGDDVYSDWQGPMGFDTPEEPAAVPFADDFSGDFQWTVVNGAEVNQWHLGFETSFVGERSVYVSNDEGRSHEYNIDQSSVVHLYRDIAFPDVEMDFTLSFYWKGQGEGEITYFDFMRVFLVDTDVDPQAGQQLTDGQIGETYNLQEEWTQEILNLTAEQYAGQTKRLVFSWRNDSSLGTQPPAAVDNISITHENIPGPEVTITIEDGMVNLSWQPLDFANAYRVFACDFPSENDDDWQLIATVDEPRFEEPAANNALRFYRVVGIVDDGGGRRGSDGGRDGR